MSSISDTELGYLALSHELQRIHWFTRDIAVIRERAKIAIQELAAIEDDAAFDEHLP